MLTVKVHLLAFGKENEVRYVKVDDPVTHELSLLDQVYHFGQNANQSQLCLDVSAGDVIELEGDRYFLITGASFKQLTRVELVQYRALPRRDRAFATIMED